MSVIFIAVVDHPPLSVDDVEEPRRGGYAGVDPSGQPELELEYEYVIPIPRKQPQLSINLIRLTDAEIPKYPDHKQVKMEQAITRLA